MKKLIIRILAIIILLLSGCSDVQEAAEFGGHTLQAGYATIYAVNNG